MLSYVSIIQYFYMEKLFTLMTSRMCQPSQEKQSSSVNQRGQGSEPQSLDGSKGVELGKIRKPRKYTLAAKAHLYASADDLTLTKSQRLHGYFRDVLKGGDFRYASNPTLGKYSSGYHEAFVTTDTFNFLRRAADNGDGTHSLPSSGGSGFWAAQRGKKVFSSTLLIVLKYSDGFRTDTAQTILSAPEGRAAGHSGSDVNTKGQKGGHDLLRQSVLDLLTLDSATTGMTEASIVAAMGGIVVTSIAPGELARTAIGGTASLKAGTPAKVNYEFNRTGAKRKVEARYNSLQPSEKIFTHGRVSRFLENTQAGLASRPRSIPTKRATSPERDPAASLTDEVAGGKYLPSIASLAPG